MLAYAGRNAWETRDEIVMGAIGLVLALVTDALKLPPGIQWWPAIAGALGAPLILFGGRFVHHLWRAQSALLGAEFVALVEAHDKLVSEVESQRKQLRRVHDWQLALLAPFLSVDPDNPVNRLETRLRFKNKGPTAIRYHVDEYAVTYAGTPAFVSAEAHDGPLLRGDEEGIWFPNLGFTAEQVEALPLRIEGTLRGIVRYGVPDEPLSRRITFERKLMLTSSGGAFRLHATIIRDTDDLVTP